MTYSANKLVLASQCQHSKSCPTHNNVEGCTTAFFVDSVLYNTDKPVAINLASVNKSKSHSLKTQKHKIKTKATYEFARNDKNH